MILLPLNKNFNNPFTEIFSGLEAWCVAFNEFALIFFRYMKYILFFIMFIIGILTLLKLRGHYTLDKTGNGEKEFTDINKLRKPRLFLGSIYIALAFGILFNWLTLAMIFVLEPLPDYPHEQTIYYAVAIGSFGAITDLLIAIWYLVNRVPFNPKMGFSLLIGGVTAGILLGFTTCLPFFL